MIAPYSYPINTSVSVIIGVSGQMPSLDETISLFDSSISNQFGPPSNGTQSESTKDGVSTATLITLNKPSLTNLPTISSMTTGEQATSESIILLNVGNNEMGVQESLFPIKNPTLVIITQDANQSIENKEITHSISIVSSTLSLGNIQDIISNGDTFIDATNIAAETYISKAAPGEPICLTIDCMDGSSAPVQTVHIRVLDLQPIYPDDLSQCVIDDGLDYRRQIYLGLRSAFEYLGTPASSSGLDFVTSVILTAKGLPVGEGAYINPSNNTDGGVLTAFGSTYIGSIVPPDITSLLIDVGASQSFIEGYETTRQQIIDNISSWLKTDEAKEDDVYTRVGDSIAVNDPMQYKTTEVSAVSANSELATNTLLQNHTFGSRNVETRKPNPDGISISNDYSQYLDLFDVYNLNNAASAFGAAIGAVKKAFAENLSENDNSIENIQKFNKEPNS